MTPCRTADQRARSRFPGLAAITSAANFAAHLDLYDGVLTESGGGMTAQIYVRADADMLVVDVTGADPEQHADRDRSISGRRATRRGRLRGDRHARRDVDRQRCRRTGATYGSLAAVTAGGRSVAAAVVDSRTVRVSFNPNTDGTFRVLVGAPTWTGGNAATTASTLFGSSATTPSATLQAAASGVVAQLLGRPRT